MLSIIIPTYQAAAKLGQTLDSIKNTAPEGEYEVIIADGGSQDITPRIAKVFGAAYINTVKGRGQQLHNGTFVANGNWYLFLHADTRLDAEWWAAVQKFMANPRYQYHAAHFRFALDDQALAARFLETIVGWRCSAFGLPYGDQGLLINSQFYDHLGGYTAIPLMEDVDLVRRIGSLRIHSLASTATTSAERFKRDGYILRPLRNLFCLMLYFAGVKPTTIEPFYK